MQNESHSRSSHPLDKMLPIMRKSTGYTTNMKKVYKSMHITKQRQYNHKLERNIDE